MGRAARTFRIFVSSTFSDLAAERNALQERVFPRLRALCLRNNARFQAIDLRWGVSQEAGLDQRTMSICLEEIDRCRTVSPKPNFIVLLGDRYGWRPLPAHIPADEFEAVTARVSDETDLELLERWYLRDENARHRRELTGKDLHQPVYVLRPRELDLSGMEPEEARERSREEAEAWGRDEADLRRILTDAIDAGALEAAGLQGEQLKEAVRRYRASATEQEISRGALQVEDAREHVFCFFRTITDLDDHLGDEEAKDFVDLLGGERDQDAKDALDDLKSTLEQKVGTSNVFPLPASWEDVMASQPPPPGEGQDEDGVPDDEGVNSSSKQSDDPYEGLPSHLQDLCEKVYGSLRGVIEDEIGRLEQEERNPLEGERSAHREFAIERARSFVGRGPILGEIAGYIEGGEEDTTRPPLAVAGASGSGKSALMARAALDAEERGGARVVMRFIGWTPESSTGRDLLDGVVHDVSQLYGATDPVPTDFRELSAELPKRMALATADRPLVVFLDALDQLAPNDPARGLAWLPTEVPPHVSLIVSTRAEDEFLQPLTRRVPVEQVRSLGPLSRDDAADLLETWLDPLDPERPSGRTLQEDQWEDILRTFPDQEQEEGMEGLPLYLKLAYEEARLWTSQDRIGREIQPLPERIPDLIRRMFARLSHDANHGALVVDRSLAYLAASRFGLSEDEIIDVLSRDREVRADFRRRQPKSPSVRRLPVVVWSRLFFDLEPYLAEREVEGARLLAFYHRQLLDVVSDDFLGEEDGETRTARHWALAEYFDRQPLDVVAPTEQREITANTRKLIELPYQQTLAGEEMWDRLLETLTDFDFLERKAAQVGVLRYTDANGNQTTTYTGIYQIREDFDLALRKMPGEGGQAGDDRRPVIVTGTDFGDGKGYVLRCPHCNTVHTFQDGWRGNHRFTCPNEACKGPLKVNDFVVPPRQ